MTRVDGATPRTAAPLALEDLERSGASDAGDLRAPELAGSDGTQEAAADERASIQAESPQATEAASESSTARSGRVLDQLGQPVVGAAVYFGDRGSGFGGSVGLDELYRAGTEWGGKILRFETGEDGRFEAELPRWKSARVAVRASGFAPYDLDQLPLPKGEDLPDVLLDQSVLLEGRVFDHLGRPVEGARIDSMRPRSGGLVITLDADFGDDESGWRSDASGRFVVDEVAVGPYRLRISHPSAPSAEVGGSSTELGQRITGIEVHLAEGADIRGVVVGLPEGRAEQYVVSAQPVENGFGALGSFGHRSVPLAEDGSFHLGGLRKGKQVSLALRSADEEDAFWGEGLAEPTNAMPGDVGVTLRFLGTTGLRLRAVDAATGEPVEQYRLEAGGWWQENLADADGKIIDQHPNGIALYEGVGTRDDGTFDLSIYATGYAPHEQSNLKAEVGQVLELGDVRLQPVPELVVKVVDAATGAPIESAAVEMMVFAEESVGLEMPWHSGDQETGTTDAQGIVRLSSRPGRSVRFSASHRNYADTQRDPDLLTGAPDQEYELRMQRGGTVELLVLDSRGEPVAGRKISHQSPHENPSLHFAPTHRGGEKSDASGKLRFERLTPGVHHFRIAERSSQSAGGLIGFSVDVSETDAQLPEEWKPVTVIEGGRHELTLHAPPASSVAGRVLENGKPLVGAGISLEERAEDESDDSDFGSYGGMEMFGGGGIKTDAQGRFQLDDEPVGPVRLTITHPRRAMPALYDFELKEGANELEVDLDVCVLRGRVTDQDGKPVVSARVSVSRSSPSGGSMTMSRSIVMLGGGGAMISTDMGTRDPVLTDADGRYELRGVAAGAALTVSVTAHDAYLEDGELEVDALSPREERAAEELQLVRGGSLRVTVGAAGASIGFCNVSVKPLEVDGDADPQFQFLQDVGELEFTGLAPGSWKLSATATDPLSGTEKTCEPQTVTIEKGQEARAELVVQ